MEERDQVTLAAIMFTDIVGYTSLTESDEALALKLLEEHRGIVRSLVLAHHGSEVKTMGDAFLIEFASAAEATRCAIEIQQALYAFNSRLGPKERVLLRIGVHLGDVVHSNKDVYGDAVNVASRIEGLSEPEGICVSRQVYDSIRNKMRDVKFESLGARQMKNVEGAVEVFKVVVPRTTEQRTPWQYNDASSPGEDPQPMNRIAVLPFVSIGSDPEGEYFADGLTEELISRLSQARELRVIARTSAMSYKGDRQRKVRDIGHELGAGTLVEGSVRKAGTKIRVSVQVVNAINEEHLWATTYDRDLDDIFAMQSDIAARVADSFSSNLAAPHARKQIAQSSQDETSDVTAYSYFLRGRHLFHGESESSVKQALEFFSKAIEEDPAFARAYVGRAECYLALAMLASLGFVEGARKAEADVWRALELDRDLPEAHAVLSQVKYALDEFVEAEREAKRAVELNPSLADAYHALGHLKWISGRIDESTELFEIAYKLDPLREENIGMLAEVYLARGRDKDALNIWSSAEHLFPQMSYSGLCLYYCTKHEYAKAEEYLQKFKLAAGSDFLFTHINEGYVAAYKGERERALEIIRQIERSSDEDRSVVCPIGLIYHALGDMDKFFECMNRAMDMHALPLGILVNSPIYSDARRDPRMRALLQRVDLKIDLTSAA